MSNSFYLLLPLKIQDSIKTLFSHNQMIASHERWRLFDPIIVQLQAPLELCDGSSHLILCISPDRRKLHQDCSSSSSSKTVGQGCCWWCCQVIMGISWRLHQDVGTLLKRDDGQKLPAEWILFYSPLHPQVKSSHFIHHIIVYTNTHLGICTQNMHGIHYPAGPDFRSVNDWSMFIVLFGRSHYNSRMIGDVH